MIDLLALLGSGGLGGVLGIVGNVIKGRGELKAKKMAMAQELSLRQLDIDEFKLEAELKNQQITLENDGHLALANVEADRARDVIDGELRKASYDVDKATYGGSFVDTIRGMMRPAITIYMLALMSYIGYQVYSVTGGIEPVKAWELYETIINSVVFLTTTCVTWYFGARPSVR